MAVQIRLVIRLLAVTVSLFALDSRSSVTTSVSAASTDVATKDRVREQYGRLPLSFERNTGQTDPRVEFISRGSGYTMFLTRGAEAVMVLSGAVLRLTLVGANHEARADGRDELPGKVNYLLGPDQQQWRHGIATYSKVAYDRILPGIDIVYYGNQQQLEYDFVVSPGADPRTIALDVEGADALEIDTQGDLLMSVGGRQVRQRKPVVYQESGGAKTEIDGRYTIEANHRVRFELAAYDTSRPLIIDPILVYSTFLGGDAGSFARDTGADIVVDSAGAAYVTGETASHDFPTTAGAIDTSWNADSDAFVTKLDAAGAALVYSTYLGGSFIDRGNAIAVDSAGIAYVTGYTQSRDFPTTPGAFDRTLTGGAAAFVTKLDAAGETLAYSTYLGEANTTGRDIAVDANGSAYVTGTVEPATFGVVPSFPTTPGAFDRTFNNFCFPFGGCGPDAFVSRFDAAGAALLYSTLLGGGGDDVATGIAIDATGNAYVTGFTSSLNFPTTAGAFDRSLNGGRDAFVTKLDALGARLTYSTYLGGSADDDGTGIAIDGNGSAFVTGSTSSSNFPTTAAAFDASLNGGADAFVTKLAAAGATLVYSTYLGGSANDGGAGIAIDVAGNVYATGATSSGDFPTTAGAFDTSVNGFDAFSTKLDAAGAALVYSTYLGGACDDSGRGIALDADGSAYVTGYTCSTDFPTTAAAFDTSAHGQHGFVTKMNTAGTALVYSTYLGGEFVFGVGDEGAGDIAIDASGSAYVTGSTGSVDFPTTTGALDTSANGRDVFVTKLDSSGGALVYSTYLGGSGVDFARAIAVDAMGNAYVTGETSGNFPTTVGAFDTSFNDSIGFSPKDVFVTKLDATGSALMYSTYLGGTGLDDARDLAIDQSGNAYVTGQTNSANFPTTAGAFDTSFNGAADAFVTKLDAAGAALVYSTYLGGIGGAFGWGIAVDTNGYAYVTGFTRSPDFPTTIGAFDTSVNDLDAFVTKLDIAGTALAFSTFLGGSGGESGSDIAVDASGSVYVTGRTWSVDFPTTAGAFDPTANGADDVFVTKIDATGATLAYSTYLGGSRNDSEGRIAVDADGSVYVTGGTSSPDFPTTTGAIDGIWNGVFDVFVTKLDATGATAEYSTFLGGSGHDSGAGIALDASGDIYVTGYTSSPNFPTTPGAYDTTFGATADVFIAKIAAAVASATLTLAPQVDTNRVGQPHCLIATVRDAFGNPMPGVSVRVTVTGMVNITGAAVTGANGNALFCYAGSPLPGQDVAAAFADFDGDGTQDAGEPSAGARKTWVLPPPAATCGDVDGQGLMLVPGGFATFALHVQQGPSAGPHGQLTYDDNAAQWHFEAISIARLIIIGKLATIHGEGSVNGGPIVPFRVDVSDGILDTFRIVWPGYSAQSFVLGQIAIATCN